MSFGDCEGDSQDWDSCVHRQGTLKGVERTCKSRDRLSIEGTSPGMVMVDGGWKSVLMLLRGGRGHWGLCTHRQGTPKGVERTCKSRGLLRH